MKNCAAAFIGLAFVGGAGREQTYCKGTCIYTAAATRARVSAAFVGSDLGDGPARGIVADGNSPGACERGAQINRSGALRPIHGFPPLLAFDICIVEGSSFVRANR